MSIDPQLYAHLIEAVDTRVKQHLAQQPRSAYGVVASVDVANQKVAVYLSGDVTASPGFLFPRHMRPTVGDRVRVVIDPRGDRYVDSIHKSAANYENVVNGYLREIRNTTGLATNVGAVEGEANERIRDIMGSGYTSVQMGVGTGTPVDVLRYNSDGTYALAGYGRLRFVPINRVEVFSSATTTTTIGPTLTPAITGIPSHAKMVAGYATLWSTSLNVSNLLALYHTDTVSNAIAAMVQAGAPSVHARLSGGFHCAVVQSGGAKLRYLVNVAAGTLTYDLFVTGYWTDDN